MLNNHTNITQNQAMNTMYKIHVLKVRNMMLWFMYSVSKLEDVLINVLLIILLITSVSNHYQTVIS